jgi:hypothetical protein
MSCVDWSGTEILPRTDSQYCSPEFPANGVDYVLTPERDLAATH